MKSSKVFLTVLLSLIAMKANALTSTQIENSDEMVLAVGSFEPVVHKVSGDYKINRVGENLILEFSDDFQSDLGPDLRVTLNDQSNKSPVIIVARLLKNSGGQKYVLPIQEKDLMRYTNVSIYCLKYQVTFGTSTIMRRGSQ